MGGPSIPLPHICSACPPPGAFSKGLSLTCNISEPALEWTFNTDTPRRESQCQSSVSVCRRPAVSEQLVADSHKLCGQLLLGFARLDAGAQERQTALQRRGRLRVTGQRSQVRGRRSEVRDQETKVWGLGALSGDRGQGQGLSQRRGLRSNFMRQRSHEGKEQRRVQSEIRSVIYFIMI